MAGRSIRVDDRDVNLSEIPVEGIRAWRRALCYFRIMSDPDADVNLPEIPLEAIGAWRRALCTFKLLSDLGSTTSRWALLIVQACLYYFRRRRSAVPEFWARGVTEAFTQFNKDIEDGAD